MKWSAFPLHPDTPEEGLTLEELFAGRLVDINQIRARLKRVADAEGLPLGERERTFNSRLAQELGKWAESRGKGDPYHLAVFRAYFADGRNIGKRDELVRLAESLGLPGEEARKILETRAFKAAVDQDWARSKALGITAVPTLVLGQGVLVGAQPYEKLESFVRAGGVGRRASH